MASGAAGYMPLPSGDLPDPVSSSGDVPHNVIHIHNSTFVGNTISQVSHVTPPPPILDCWTGGSRSLPSKEQFMLGPEKLESIAKLKNAVMDSKTGRAVAAVGVVGMGGVGKTTACLVVASDDEVGKIYRDAVLWMNMGIEVAADAVVDQLAVIVESTGGVSRARLMRDMFKDRQKLDPVREKARDWFNGRSVLLVVDNVFPASEDLTPRHWVQFLMRVLGPGSCLLFTTRAWEVSGESDVQIEFKPLATPEQQSVMLLSHLGQTDRELESSQIQTLLDFCCGLPIALATAAALVRRLNFDWIQISRTLQASIWDPSKPSPRGAPRFSAKGGHDGLASVFSVGLRALELSTEGSLHPDYSWTDLYISLSFIDKSFARVPVGVLSILWETDVYVAERTCMGFQDMALGQLRTGNCTSNGVFEMHDLQLAYAVWRSGCEDMLDGQTASGQDLRALPCKVEESFRDTWSHMHSECGCTAQLSSASDVTLAREAVIWCYTVTGQVRTLESHPRTWAVTQINMGDALSDRVPGDRAENIERALLCYQGALKFRTREAVPQDWARIQEYMGLAFYDRVLGDRADNIERALSCYNDSLQVWTREAMPYYWASVQMNLGLAFYNRVRGDCANNIESALICYQNALETWTREAVPHDWALVQMNMGNAWKHRVLGNRADNIERALACYNEALQVRTREAMPHEWAMIQMNVGIALFDRIVGNRAENIERAIACYGNALQIWTCEAAPREWATAQMNLGTAWNERQMGDRSGDIECALSCYSKALEIRTRETLPHEWARAQIRTGAAWSDRVCGDRADNIERALACFDNALEVFTLQAMPSEWALIQMNKGAALRTRVVGNRADNIELALACYDDALGVRTRQAVPHEWAKVQMNIGVAFCDRVVGERADNIERAIACYKDALQVWTREASPHEWAIVQRNMGAALFEREVGDISDNCDQALACWNEALHVFTQKGMLREAAALQSVVDLVMANGPRVIQE